MSDHRPRGRSLARPKLATDLARAEPPRRQWRRWGGWEPALAGTTFEGVRSELHDRNGSFDRNDDLLAALVRIAQHHDLDAVWVIVACLLPGLQRWARRQDHLGWEDAFSEIVVALCGHIQRYDTSRCPSYVAANLLQDAARDLRRATVNARAHAEHVCSLESAAEIPELCTELTFTASFLLTSATETGIVSRSDAGLIYASRLMGVPLDDAARTLGIGYEAAKKRCQRARRHLRIWWLDTKDPP